MKRVTTVHRDQVRPTGGIQLKSPKMKGKNMAKFRPKIPIFLRVLAKKRKILKYFFCKTSAIFSAPG